MTHPVLIITLHSLLVLSFTFSYVPTADAKDTKQAPWDSAPLHGLAYSIRQSMSDYEEWSTAWKKTKRKIEDKDHIINSMMEAGMVATSSALHQHPSPALLEDCLLFIGRHVPEEFDESWLFVLLELPDVNKQVAAKVAQMLEKEGRRTLKQRMDIAQSRLEKERKAKTKQTNGDKRDK